jgi:hypothetical protein
MVLCRRMQLMLNLPTTCEQLLLTHSLTPLSHLHLKLVGDLNVAADAPTVQIRRLFVADQESVVVAVELVKADLRRRPQRLQQRLPQKNRQRHQQKSRQRHQLKNRQRHQLKNRQRHQQKNLQQHQQKHLQMVVVVLSIIVVAAARNAAPVRRRRRSVRQ